MAKVIDQKGIEKLLTMAGLCHIAQRSDGPFSGHLAGLEYALMSIALETMLRGDISQQITAEIGDGIEQCQ